MRLFLRTSILGVVLAATPVSLSAGFLSPSDDYIVLAMSDVIACDSPRSVPNNAAEAYPNVNFEDAAPLWGTDIYDLVDCLRMKTDAI